MKADIKVDDRGEETALMEPLLLGPRFREPLTDLALDLAQKSATFRASLPVSILNSLAELNWAHCRRRPAASSKPSFIGANCRAAMPMPSWAQVSAKHGALFPHFWTKGFSHRITRERLCAELPCFAARDATGAILGFYDAVDSPAPSGIPGNPGGPLDARTLSRTGFVTR